MSAKPALAFFHQNYPAQFGPIIGFLQEQNLAEIYFFSEFASRQPAEGIKHFFYKSDNVNLPAQPYFFSRYFEAESRSMFGVYNAFKNAQIPEPTAFIGHVGFGNLGLLHSAYPEIPTIGFFEIFYDSFAGNSSRPPFDIPWPNKIRIPLRNATHLIELEYCTKCYSPTNYQKSTFPLAYQNKLKVLFDGIDTNLYKPISADSKSDLEITWPSNAPIITFVSRGLEAMRGFDIFMEMAHKISLKNPDVHFVVVGREKTNYGSELIHLKDQSFKQYVLQKFKYDLNRFHFFEWISEPALAELFRLTTCHFYWTMPFVLSWSFFQAMASGALILASAVPPVEEVMQNEKNGLLTAPFEIDFMVEKMLEILKNPNKFKHLQTSARETIEQNYS